jgi:hypothetical protein
MKLYCDSQKAIKLSIKEEIEAARIANPLLEIPISTGELKSLSDEDLGIQLAGYRLTFWPNPAVINVHFTRGSAADHQRVKQTVEQLEAVCNCWFTFDENKPSDVRVGFQPNGGNWSAVGTACKSPVYQGKTTMNLQERDPATGILDEGTILHEFCHALGFSHEHQHPLCSLKWIETNVLNDLKAPPNNWDEARIRRNMFGRLPQKNYVFGSYDTKSIMHYKIEAHWHDDAYAIPWNNTLSAEDRRMLPWVYPSNERKEITTQALEASFKVRKGDQVTCIPVDVSPEGTLHITFGDPTNISGYIRPGLNEHVELADTFQPGANQVNLRVIQRGGLWKASYRLLINGAEVYSSPYMNSGDGGISPMHVIANLHFLYK